MLLSKLCTNLRVLNLSYTNTTDDLFMMLLKLTKLTALNMSYTPISFLSLDAMSKFLTGLRVLDLDGCSEITNASVQRLIENVKLEGMKFLGKFQPIIIVLSIRWCSNISEESKWNLRDLKPWLFERLFPSQTIFFEEHYFLQRIINYPPTPMELGYSSNHEKEEDSEELQ
jgi:hypothetical protein